jgi:hypothetical protein
MRSTSTRRRGDGGPRLRLNEAQAKMQSQARAVEARTRLRDGGGSHEVGRGAAELVQPRWTNRGSEHGAAGHGGRNEAGRWAVGPLKM